MIAALNYGLKGSFGWRVIDEASMAVEQSGAKQNLILNQGIDYCFQRSFVENMQACALSSLYIAPLKTDTYLQGEFTRTDEVETSSDNQTSTVVTSANAGGGFSYPVRTVTWTKTFRFPRFNVRTQIGMIGISPSNVSGANLFAKSLIGEAPISVDPGKYLQLTYSLDLTYPSSLDLPVPITTDGYSTLNYLGNFGPSNLLIDPSISAQNGAGWNASGWSAPQLVGLMAISANGTISPYREATSGAVNMVTGFQTGWNGSEVVLSGVLGTPTGVFSGQACNEPASGAWLFLSKNGQSPNMTSCSIDRSASASAKTGATVTYLGGGLGVKSASFGRAVAITGVYSWGIGGAVSPEKNCGFVYVSTGAMYSGGSYVTGLASNGYPGFTKTPSNELNLQFFYNVTSL